MDAKITAAEMEGFLRTYFPDDTQGLPTFDSVTADMVRLTLTCDASHLRPGDMVSGPTQMTLADTVAYACVFARLGVTPMAVTNNLNIHFLRPCIGPKVSAEGRVVRFGRRLAVIDVRIFGEGHADPSAIATVSYALPQSG